jgi:hypothetical protein
MNGHQNNASARAFHMSGKTDVESGMIFRREGVPMAKIGIF